jgi:hypothetical protein
MLHLLTCSQNTKCAVWLPDHSVDFTARIGFFAAKGAANLEPSTTAGVAGAACSVRTKKEARVPGG